jgi:nucleoside-triphosphatase
MISVYLLTGRPGAGKTTLIREVVARLSLNAGGFYTEELRASGVRQGFKIITLDGQEAILSHVGISSSYKVSKYGVDINSLEEVGVTAIRQALKHSDLVIIDEIGKMELLSPQFSEAVLEAIDSGKKVLGTILLPPHPFADRIKKDPRVKLIEVNRGNHDQALKQILSWLRPATDEHTS